MVSIEACALWRMCPCMCFKRVSMGARVGSKSVLLNAVSVPAWRIIAGDVSHFACILEKTQINAHLRDFCFWAVFLHMSVIALLHFEAKNKLGGRVHFPCSACKFAWEPNSCRKGHNGGLISMNSWSLEPNRSYKYFSNRFCKSSRFKVALPPCFLFSCFQVFNQMLDSQSMEVCL